MINGNYRVLLTDVVLVETIWTLKGKKYKCDNSSIISVVSKLFQEKNITFEDPQVIWQTLNGYCQAKTIKNNHADVLIVSKAKFYASKQGITLHDIYTFDKAAQLLDGV